MHSFGGVFAFDELIENKNYPRIQANLMPSFRKELTEDIALREYSCTEVASLPINLRTEKWKRLSEFCGNYRKLSDEHKSIILRVLCKLCFYEQVTSLEKGYSNPSNFFQFEVNYWLFLAKYIQFSDGGIGKYDISLFSDLSRNAPKGTLVKVNAIYQVVVQNVKDHNNLEQTIYWQNEHNLAVKEIQDNVDPFVYKQILSRYHRVGGFIPQLQNDPVRCSDEMQLAEDVARDLFTHKSNDESLNFIYNKCAQEILFPVLESRIKEAFWLENYDLACERAFEIQKLSPADPRVYLHLGEALLRNNRIPEALLSYEKSVFFSVSNVEVPYFMVGQCYEKLGDVFRAQNAYMQSIIKDPEGISSIEALKKISSSMINESEIISSWLTENENSNGY